MAITASLPVVRRPEPERRAKADHRRAVVATVAGATGVVVPPYVTAFLIALPQHVVPLLLLPVLLVPAFAVVAVVRSRRSSIELRGDGLHDRRVLPPDRVIPTADIASIIVLRVIEPRTLRAPRHLFVLDGAGRTRFRMRETIWGADQLDLLRSRLAVPAQVVDEPLTLADLRQQRVVRLPWWERSPLRAGLALAVVMVATSAVLLVPVMDVLR